MDRASYWSCWFTRPPRLEVFFTLLQIWLVSGVKAQQTAGKSGCFGSSSKDTPLLCVDTDWLASSGLGGHVGLDGPLDFKRSHELRSSSSTKSFPGPGNPRCCRQAHIHTATAFGFMCSCFPLPYKEIGAGHLPRGPAPQSDVTASCLAFGCDVVDSEVFTPRSSSSAALTWLMRARGNHRRQLPPDEAPPSAAAASRHHRQHFSLQQGLGSGTRRMRSAPQIGSFAL